MQNYPFRSSDNKKARPSRPTKAGLSPTLRELEVAMHVAESGSFKAAAAKLQISAPRVWRTVDNLQEKLSVQIFRALPGGRGVELTGPGHELLGPITQATQAARVLRERADRARIGQASEVRVVCYPIHVQKFLAVALAEFRKSWKDVRVAMVALSDAAPADGGIEIVARLVRGEADVAIAPRGATDSSVFDETYLYNWTLQVGTKPEHVRRFGKRFRQAWRQGRPNLPVRALKGVPLLVAPNGFRSREAIRDACLRTGFEPEILGSSSSSPSLFALADEGLGVVVLPSDAYPSSLCRKNLIGPENAPIGGAFSAYRCRRPQSAPPDERGDPIDYLIARICARTENLRNPPSDRDEAAPEKGRFL